MSLPHDLIDDSTGETQVIGLKNALSISDRFSRRLSLMVKSKVTLEEGDGEVAIYVAHLQDGVVNEETKSFLRDLEAFLPQIHIHGQGLQFDQACDDLWDSMLDFSYVDIDRVIRSIQQLFRIEATKYAEFCECHSGVNDVDERGSQLDIELGNQVIKLHHATLDYNTSPKAANGLVQDAVRMVQAFEYLVERLMGLLRSQFGRKLYELVCELGAVERARGTFVRIAKTTASFGRVKIRFGDVPVRRVSRPRARVDSVHTLARPSTAFKAPQGTRPSPGLGGSHLSPRPGDGIAKLFRAVQPYLAPEDQSQGFIRLQPVAKQTAAVLVFCITRNNIPPENSDAYYDFGFAVCADVQRLGGLYKVVLAAGESKTVFSQLWQALESNTLVSLFDGYEYSGFREYCPELEGFLSKPRESRPTVWRLVQFLRDDASTDPGVHLQRDYGFKLCKGRDDVQRLKEVYAAILQKVGPLRLHQACVDRQLLQLAVNVGVDVGTGDRQAISASSGCGYENRSGLTGREGPLFGRR